MSIFFGVMSAFFFAALFLLFEAYLLRAGGAANVVLAGIMCVGLNVLFTHAPTWRPLWWSAVVAAMLLLVWVVYDLGKVVEENYR